jgi:hypothetical protein
LVVRVCGRTADSRGRGRKFPVAARKIPKRLDDSGDAAESGGATQGSSRCGALASVKVGHKPQEGWCPWFATLGYTEPSAIETLKHPSGGFCFLHRKQESPKFPLAGDPDEVPERRAREHRARRGGREGLEEETRTRLPCPDRKVLASRVGSGLNPKDAGGMKQARHGCRRSKTSRG